MATITAGEFRNGKTLTYEFWPYATRRCLYTVNGKGEFYVLKESVQSLLDNAKKVVNGEDISYMN